MCQEAIQPPTEECRSHVVRLKVMVGLHVAFGLLQILSGIFLNVFFQEGIITILLGLVVWMSMNRLSAMPLASVIFFCFYFAVDFCQYFLVPVQNGAAVSLFNSKQMFVFCVSVISCAFNIFCLVYYYYPYKCFRRVAILTTHPTTDNRFNPHPINHPHKREQNSRSYNQQPMKNPYNLQQLNNAYQKDPQYVPPPKKQNSFKPFQGKGVRIG